MTSPNLILICTCKYMALKRCRWHPEFQRGILELKIMDRKEGSSTSFMPDDLLEIFCILERGEKHNSYKIIRKRNYFSLITKFPAKNGESIPLKNCASARRTTTHQEKREFSSDDKLANKRRKRRRNKSSHASRSASHHTDKK